MKTARVNGTEIAYVIEPGALPGRPWMVLSHSLAADHSMWWPQVDHFAPRFNLLRFDTRGHGRSAVPPPPYTLDQLADDLLQLLAAERIDRCHYVGLSMGGMIGQVAALRDPRPFASLVIADSSSRMPPEIHPAWEQRIAAATADGMGAVAQSTLERWFTEPFRKRRPDDVARVDRLIRATQVQGYVGCSRAIMQLDITARLGQLRCPVLVVVGDKDPSTPPAMSQAIAAAVPGAKLDILADAAHFANVEQVERFNASLDRFYAGLAGLHA